MKYQWPKRFRFFQAALLLVIAVPFWSGHAASAADPERMLEEAMSYARQSSGYRVATTIINGERRLKLTAQVAGDDFDISLETGMAFRKVGRKNWISEDVGKSWHVATPDDALFNFLRAPLIGGNTPKGMNYVEVQRSQRGTEHVIWLELKPKAKTEMSYPIKYSLGVAQDGRVWIEKFIGPVLWAGSVVLVESDYSDYDRLQKITPPSGF